MEQIPSELLVLIFKFLSVPKQLIYCTLVCKVWHKASRAAQLWDTLCLSKHRAPYSVLSKLPCLGIASNLKHLDVSQTLVTDSELNSIISAFPFLETLNLCLCYLLQKPQLCDLKYLKTLVLSPDFIYSIPTKSIDIKTCIPKDVIKINVKTLAGKVFPLYVDPSKLTGLDLKTILNSKTGDTVHSIRLVFMGKLLIDDKLLSEANLVNDDCYVHMILTLRD